MAASTVHDSPGQVAAARWSRASQGPGMAANKFFTSPTVVGLATGFQFLDARAVAAEAVAAG
ncbi:MAG: hypothetical protein ACRDZQ_09640 [Acidimicrobiales bacterium]